MKMSGFRTFNFYGSLFFLCTGIVLIHTGFHSKLCHAGVGNNTDMLALLALKDQISKDPFQVLSFWNQSLHFCQWKGVTCGSHHQRVTGLNLSSLKLSGELSASIGNLSFLRFIDLRNNSFTGQVPQEIGRLYRLQELYLHNNSFEGYIPKNLSGCSQMTALVLAYNNLKGYIPMELGGLTKLLTLDISCNSLSGTIPPSLGNLSSPYVLWLQENQIEGAIPESLGQLKSLISLDLGSNMLSGFVPSSLYNLSNLVELYLNMNRLEGSLPRNLGTREHGLPNMERFLFGSNKFSGTIPVSLSNASKLYIFDLSWNNFSGDVPINFGSWQELGWLALYGNHLGNGDLNDLSFIKSLTNCSQLHSLGLGDNNFGGVLPHSIVNLSTTLSRLNLKDNHISGNIPQIIRNLVGLEKLDFSHNQLTGAIPETIGSLYKLQEVSLGGNNLSGMIPSSIGNLTFLNVLHIFGNNHEGRIPTSLGNCHGLLLLDLSDNLLTGEIPREVMGLSSLSRLLDLSANHLSGPLPPEVSSLKNLAILDISRNNLFGEIPASLGSCTSLVGLYMNRNSFGGSIPSSLSYLRGISDIDLSLNNLSGELPNTLATLSLLENLNLSFNNFEGEVPLGGVFSNTSAISLVGNEKLCGGIPDLQLPKCFTSESSKHKAHLLKLIISPICGLLGIALVFYLLLLYRRNKKARKQLLVDPTSSWLVPSVNLSYGDIFRSTDGFSFLNFIGMGNFGAVYRGILKPQKQIVAIKVLNLQARGATRSFMAECEAMRNIRHRNLVKVITACSSMDYQGNDFKALVYEFMENGCLETWLHHPERKTLSFSQRLNVVIDVAVALDYLHNHCEMPIIHRNLHPGNILLDKDMTAHVTDFGLAKMVEKSESEMHSSLTSSSCIKGRIGYSPPEYGIGCGATIQGDMYSFGIIILEIFTGKRPTDDSLMDGLNLHNMAKKILQTGVMENVDHALLQEIECRNASVLECFTGILGIGVACSEELPANRPNISNVVTELMKTKNLLLRDRNSRHF